MENLLMLHLFEKWDSLLRNTLRGVLRVQNVVQKVTLIGNAAENRDIFHLTFIVG